MSHQLTHEQNKAIQLFQTGQNLRVNAFAGTGKTFTLVEMAKSTNRTGLYLAFNKAIVHDAKGKFSPNVECMTIHSLARKGLPPGYRNNQLKLVGSLKGHEITNILNLQPFEVVKGLTLMPGSLGFLVRKTIDRFFSSIDHNPAAHHVPSYGRLAVVPDAYQLRLRAHVASWAHQIWNRMVTPNDPLPLGFEGYLKFWALSQPQLPYHFIMLDEAQDTNPVVLDILQRQTSQVVYVGDKYQQIYEWRGSTDAMENIHTPLASQLTCSFRFGPKIAQYASHLLGLLGEQYSVTGNSEISSNMGPINGNHTVLCRTNYGVMGEMCWAVQAGLKPYVVGQTVALSSVLKEVAKLKKGYPSTHQDFLGFSNWTEIVDFSKSPEGEELKVLVSIVNNYGEEELLNKLSCCVDNENQANIIISTAHKSKGLQWPYVRLCNDFKSPKQHDDGRWFVNPAEVRLLYVAITRGQYIIDLPESVMKYFNMPPGPVYHDSPV